jgi:integrase
VIRCISDPLVKVLAILIAVTGMRISEALALSWDAIDWIREKSVYGASGMASPMVLRSPA